MILKSTERDPNALKQKVVKEEGMSYIPNVYLLLLLSDNPLTQYPNLSEQ